MLLIISITSLSRRFQRQRRAPNVDGFHFSYTSAWKRAKRLQLLFCISIQSHSTFHSGLECFISNASGLWPSIDNWSYPTYHAKECEKNFDQFWLPVSRSFSVSHIHCFSRILFSCPTWGMCTFEISFFIMVLLFNLLHILISLYSLSNRSDFISSELSPALEILSCR